MARWRAVHKSISTSEKVNALIPLAVPRHLVEFTQLLFTWIVTHCDDWGRIDATPFYVKHNVMPSSRRSTEAFAMALQGLHDVDLATLYADERGVACLQVLQWDRLQPGLHKRTKSSDFPDPPKHVTRKDLRRFPGNSRLDLDVRLRLRDRPRGTSEAFSACDMAFSSALRRALAETKQQRVSGTLLVRLPDEIKRRLGHLDPRIRDDKNRRLYESWVRWADHHQHGERVTAVIRACITQTLMDARDHRADGKPIIKTTAGRYFFGMVRSRLKEAGWPLPAKKAGRGS